MSEQSIHTHQFDNGLTLVVEPMADVQSAAFSLIVPAGSIYDPKQKNGTAAILCDWIVRGAGKRDSKQLAADLDTLGLQRHESIGTNHMGFSGATVAENLPKSLAIFSDVLRRPHLPEDQFAAARAGIEQTLLSMEDEPRQKIITELRRRCYPTPWGLPTDGDLNDLDNIGPDAVRDHFARCFRPGGSILGIAGKVDVQGMIDLVGDLLGDWPSLPDPAIEVGPRGQSRDHIPHESTQIQIGIAYDSVPYRDPEYYSAWASVSILSGGMSSRLFTEVREKRGLCYAVHASHSSLLQEGRVLCYAGTTEERAQETLEVTLKELTRLGEGITQEELNRCKARAKSSLIMQQESTGSRAASVARDWFHLGRVTTLAEIRQKIEGLTVGTVLAFLQEHPARDFAILTLGPHPLEVPLDVS